MFAFESVRNIRQDGEQEERLCVASQRNTRLEQGGRAVHITLKSSMNHQYESSV